MNTQAIIAMAREAGVSALGLNIDGSIHLLGLFERFAALVAAKERDACAKVCLELHSRDTPWGCAVAIRARGTKEELV